MNNTEQILEYIQKTQAIVKSAKELAQKETERQELIKKQAAEVVQKLVELELLDKDNVKLAEQALQDPQGWFDLAINLMEHIKAAKVATNNTAKDIPVGTIDNTRTSSDSIAKTNFEYAPIIGDIDYRFSEANKILTQRILSDINSSGF